jgi:thiosulfate/3-mercaptopyruvate sulfurtransferase
MAKVYTYPPGEGKVKWISAEWLGEHLEDEDLMILNVQPNIHDYIMGHIPGAVYMNEGLFRATWKDQPAIFVPPEAIQPVLRQTGLRSDVPVVVYTGAGPYSKCTAGIGDGLEQTMAAYSLVRYGHDNVCILDGGIEGWREGGGKLTKVFPRVEESDFQVVVRKEYFLDYQEFKAAKDREDVILFDARPAPSYEGAAMWPKPGLVGEPMELYPFRHS